jgi:hypothetical protein
VRVTNRDNYNVLGKTGPFYPQTEYRPPVKSETEGAARGSPQGESGARPKDSVTLSPGAARKKTQENPESLPKLSAESAKSLARETAGLISALSPGATGGCPHHKAWGYGLLYPTYA